MISIAWKRGGLSRIFFKELIEIADTIKIETIYGSKKYSISNTKTDKV